MWLLLCFLAIVLWPLRKAYWMVEKAAGFLDALVTNRDPGYQMYVAQFEQLGDDELLHMAQSIKRSGNVMQISAFLKVAKGRGLSSNVAS
jgi:hypothetical protein